MSAEKPVIGLVLYPDVTQLDLTAPYEVFARLPEARAYVISGTLEPVVSERGLKLVPDTTYDLCPPLDVLFIPGGPGQIRALEDASLMHFVSRYGNRPGCLIASVCTGALILGSAGLLRGKKATTHWSCMDILPYFGAIPVEEPFVEDGHIITGAGVTNGIDLALHVAEKLCGNEITRRIARMIEYPHASAQADKAALDELSARMLSENSHYKTRLEIAQHFAARLGIQVA